MLIINQHFKHSSEYMELFKQYITLLFNILVLINSFQYIIIKSDQSSLSLKSDQSFISIISTLIYFTTIIVSQLHQSKLRINEIRFTTIAELELYRIFTITA